MTWEAGALPACGGCELGRARWHLGRAVAELEEARLAWGVWADGIRQLAEQRLGADVFFDFRVLDDPGYRRALQMGTPFDEAVNSAETALATAGRGEDSGAADCPCREVRTQIGSPHP